MAACLLTAFANPKALRRARSGPAYSHMKIAVGKSAVRLCCHLRWGLLFGVAEGAKGCLSATTSCFGLFARALVVCPGTLLSKIRAACSHVPSGVY